MNHEHAFILLSSWAGGRGRNSRIRDVGSRSQGQGRKGDGMREAWIYGGITNKKAKRLMNGADRLEKVAEEKG